MLLTRIMGCPTSTGRLPLLAVVLFAALLVACTAYLVHGSYNPFLYFQF